MVWVPRRRAHNWEPAWSPTMAGGLFAIDKVLMGSSLSKLCIIFLNFLYLSLQWLAKINSNLKMSESVTENPLRF